MGIEGNGTDDPIRQDADAIAKDAADLGQRRTKEVADAQDRAVIATEETELQTKLQALKDKDAGLAADQAAQRAGQAADVADIAQKDQDAQRRIAGAGAVPGPTPAPQPPRPRVG